MKSSFLAGLALATIALTTATTTASAQTMMQIPPPSGVLNLSASATIEVQKDVLAIAFSTTREGADAQAVQSQLKQALDAALAEARRVAKPGQVEVQTGNFALYPRYGNPNKQGQPMITGWQGSTELMVSGKDSATIAALAGRIQSLSIARVQWQLSREAREKVEADAAAQAIAKFRAQAAQMSQAFGYKGYTVREVNVNLNDQSAPPQPMMMARAKMSAMADESLPTEAGKGDVVAMVNGSVQMQ
jgi:predicted secreted protein